MTAAPVHLAGERLMLSQYLVDQIAVDCDLAPGFFLAGVMPVDQASDHCDIPKGAL